MRTDSEEKLDQGRLVEGDIRRQEINHSEKLPYNKFYLRSFAVDPGRHHRAQSFDR